MRSRRRRLLLMAAAFTILAGCGDDAVAPEPEPKPSPEPKSPTLDYLDIAAGPDRTCAVLEDGTVLCWGLRLFGGEAGTIALVPVPVPGVTARSIALGGDHTCALAMDGSAWCWGSNRFGQGGRADPDPVRLPRPVEDTLQFERLATGALHTCARTGEDDIWCWGRGGRGSIGSPDLADSNEPILLGARWRSYTDFDVGGHHGCAIGEEDQDIYCWGWNLFGQLGVGVFFDLGSPERIARPGPWQAVFAGEHHTCALDSDGAAWCWGRGDAGQLGHGATAGSSTPVAVAGGLRFERLALGLDHTCGLDPDGVAYCWGHNRYGRLGTGGLETVLVPVPTAVDTELRFERVSAGHLHTCAISLERRAYCWGHGGFGQLGTGGILSAPTPEPVRRPGS
jgi:alpha-tubulin suppressor-like RCC1 family protein